MALHDWIEVGMMAILTIITIGRWAEAREQIERASSKDLTGVEQRCDDEHERIWTEVERNRDHWHRDLVPWQQGMAERLVSLEQQVRNQTIELERVTRLLDRQRS